MVVTTFNIPENLLSFMGELIRTGRFRTRREIVVKALEIYVRFEAQNWNGPMILIHGLRNGLVSKGGIAELVVGMSEEERHNAGKRMGKTLRDLTIGRHLDVSFPENYKAALSMLEDLGWGRFMMDNNRITITESILPGTILHGYLETALGVTLNKIDTTEDVIAFEIKTALLAKKATPLTLHI